MAWEAWKLLWWWYDPPINQTGAALMSDFWVYFLVAVISALALPAIYFCIFMLWNKLPDGRLKKILFRSYFGQDNGPWATAEWQRPTVRRKAAERLQR
ncbi:hypothetical protein [Xanthomonas citri]|uniref:hypothetical protein n=1 Tax=Xanthomonas citri TaxID=346 RepID=UPI0012FD3DCD|nr:hypothetical protein [Xanthomonas citri]